MCTQDRTTTWDRRRSRGAVVQGAVTIGAIVNLRPFIEELRTQLIETQEDCIAEDDPPPTPESEAACLRMAIGAIGYAVNVSADFTGRVVMMIDIPRRRVSVTIAADGMTAHIMRIDIDAQFPLQARSFEIPATSEALIPHLRWLSSESVR